MDKMLLSQYNPSSELIVEEHLLTKPKFPAYDIHTHMGKLLPGKGYQQMYKVADFAKIMEDLGIYHWNNLDGVWGKDLDDMIAHEKGFEDKITNFCWVDTESISDIDFASKAKANLKDAYAKGCRGIKMWKVITLGQKDASGKYIRTDDERLKPVYETAAELGMPILIHIADPYAFFKPITADNERIEELGVHPDWSFYKPELGLYGFEELMEMQDNMIRNNPDTTFIVAHFGSYAENLAHVAERLDAFPNMYVDTAARIAELGRQPYTARKFFLKYADRILFGTDAYPFECIYHTASYRFFETFDEYFPYEPTGKIPTQGRWRIYGIGLPDDVLKKIYFENAERLMHLK